MSGTVECFNAAPGGPVGEEGKGSDISGCAGLSSEEVERLARERRSWLVGALRNDGWSQPEAEDAVQEALLAVLQQRDQIQTPERAHLWALTVARRSASRAQRRGRRECPDEHDAPDLHAPQSSDVAVRQQVVEALEALAEDDRRALVGQFELGLSGVELAAALGRTHAATRTLVHRARARFRTVYGPLGVAPLAVLTRWRLSARNWTRSLATGLGPHEMALLAVSMAILAVSVPLSDSLGPGDDQVRPALLAAEVDQAMPRAGTGSVDGDQDRAEQRAVPTALDADPPIPSAESAPAPETVVAVGDWPVIRRYPDPPPDPWLSVSGTRDDRPAAVVYWPAMLEDLLPRPPSPTDPPPEDLADRSTS